MRTDALIDLLARGAGPAAAAPAARRLAPAALAGLAASALLALAVNGPVPTQMLGGAALWIKLAYAAALALAGGWLAARLARPLPRPGGAALAVAAVAVVMALLGVLALRAAPEGARMQALLGESWRTCPRNVLLLSLPGLAAALWALRGLAPTRLRAAGAAAGLFAGALGALGYALTCGEVSPAFVATWYTLGIAASAGLGALLGPRWLRW